MQLILYSLLQEWMSKYLTHILWIVCFNGFLFTAAIFDGAYGSEYEYNLEMELDVLQDRKTRIGIAKYKWTNARVLLQHAVNQLAYAVKRLEELKTVAPA